VTQTVTLNSGSNTIAYKAVTSSTACINLDNITIPSITGPLVGTCSVAGTGSWQTWATRTCTVTGATGIHDLYLRFTGGSGLLFNFNWWKFNSATGTGPLIEKSVENGNLLKVKICYGITTSLLLDFAPSISQKKIRVCLFDLNGRLATTLFAGQCYSTRLILPVSRAAIRPGTYMVSVFMGA
jgi:hypothetical protein